MSTIEDTSVANPELRDATALVGDPVALRARMVEDGYLFLPGLLDPEVVPGVRRQVLEILAAHQGWLADDTEPMEGIAGPEPRTYEDEGWWEVFAGVLGLEGFNRLPFQAALTDVVGALVDGDLLVHPNKIARLTYPSRYMPTNPHQDYHFIRGAVDTLTAWVPLGAVSGALGGLRLIPGSHRDGRVHPMERAVGAGNARIADIGENDPSWTAPHDYRPGDVVVFHSLMVHWGPANHGDRVRLSADFRFQSLQDPIRVPQLLPHLFGREKGAPGWNVLTEGWESTAWIDPPGPVRLAPWRVDPDHVPPSRLLGAGA